MIRCISCDHTEPIGSLFCCECGKPLAVEQAPQAPGKNGPGTGKATADRSQPLPVSLELNPDLTNEFGFGYRLLHSKGSLIPVEESQVHYLLLDLFSAENTAEIRPTINLCLVIDRSTSMRGERLDRVKYATVSILEALEARDMVTLISFSDRAETILRPDEARQANLARSRLSFLKAGGGTEIGQGLRSGLDALYNGYTTEAVNHIILLTDGRTYGDEQDCLAMADEAAEKGITINAIGIGSDWSDQFLDDVAGRTGGNVVFLDRSWAVKNLLRKIFDSLGHVIASGLRIEGELGPGIRLLSAFRFLPDPMPMDSSLPLNLGHLPSDRIVRLLFELEVSPIKDLDQRELARFSIQGNLIAKEEQTQTIPLEISLPMSLQGEEEGSPQEIVTALGALTLYRLQEKAREDAENGEIIKAVRRLETLATHLQAIKEESLANAAIEEARRLIRSMRLSEQGSKVLKYGTRTLLLMAQSEKP